MMFKKAKITFYILLGFIFSISIIANIYLILINKKTQQNNDIPPNLYTSIDNFTNVLSVIHYAYYKDIPANELITYAIKGMLENLDPYSTIINQNEFNDIKNYTKGEFYGIGIKFIQNRDKSIEVVSPIEDSPAFQAGISSGDKLASINGENVSDMNLTDVSQKLKGEVGTKVNLTFLKNSQENEAYSISLERKLLQSPTVSYKIYRDNIAYLQISSINEKTTELVNKYIQQINSTNKNIKGYILDLRNNPGGVFEEGISLANLFINGGKIVTLKNRNQVNDKTFFATGGDIANSLPMIVLINNQTASSAEILAGALRDNKRALILGTISYGKAMVQTIIPINNSNDKIKLTTGTYILPNGSEINHIGIYPDIFVFANGKTCSNCSTLELENLIVEENLYLINTSYTNSIDYQLNKALNLLDEYK